MKFGSISQYPGSTGRYYYLNFFRYYNVKADYVPLKAGNIQEVKVILSDSSYLGFNISMPFKQQVMESLIFLSSEVINYESCNTIKNLKDGMHGFNTDIYGILKVTSYILKTDYVIILGNGAMGKMFAKFLTKDQIKYKIFSPSLKNWENRHENCDVLINCTAFGTSINLSPIDRLEANRVVIDLAIGGQKLNAMCKNVKYISGLEFYKEVFLQQFFIHTGILPDSEYFDYITIQIT